MFKDLIEQGILFYVIAGICVVGTLSSLIVSFLYGRLARDARNMVTPKTKLMKQIKNKFEDSYKLNEIVNNVPVFVEKWMERYKVLGISLHGLQRIGVTAMAVSTVLSAGGLYLASDYEYSTQTQINYLAAGIASILLLIAVRGIADCTYKQKVILVNIRDYLENSLINRIGHETRNIIRIKERTSTEGRVTAVNKQSSENTQARENRSARENHKTRESKQPIEYQTTTTYQAETDYPSDVGYEQEKRRKETARHQSIPDFQPATVNQAATDFQAASNYQQTAEHGSVSEYRKPNEYRAAIDSPANTDYRANAQQTSQKDRQARSAKGREKLSDMEVKENIERMKQSMNQIAASTPEQKQANKEILKGMDPKRQEEVIREMLKEFLS